MLSSSVDAAAALPKPWQRVTWATILSGVRVNAVHLQSAGAINESDITLQILVVIGFNASVLHQQARQQAEGPSSRHHLLYIEEIEDAKKGMLDPEFEEKSWVKLLSVKPSKVSKSEQSVGSWLVKSPHSRPCDSMMVSL